MYLLPLVTSGTSLFPYIVGGVPITDSERVAVGVLRLMGGGAQKLNLSFQYTFLKQFDHVENNDGGSLFVRL